MEDTKRYKLIYLIGILICFFSYISNNCKSFKINEVQLMDTTKLSKYSADSLYNLSMKYYFEKEDTLNGSILFNYALQKGSIYAIIDNALNKIERNDTNGLNTLYELYYNKEPLAYTELGLILVKVDKMKGFTLLDSAILLGDSSISIELAILYETGKSSILGISVIPDTISAIYYYKIASNSGSMLAQYNLGSLFFYLHKYDIAKKYLNMCIENNYESFDGESKVQELSKETISVIDSIFKINR